MAAEVAIEVCHVVEAAAERDLGHAIVTFE